MGELSTPRHFTAPPNPKLQQEEGVKEVTARQGTLSSATSPFSSLIAQRSPPGGGETAPRFHHAEANHVLLILRCFVSRQAQNNLPSAPPFLHSRFFKGRLIDSGMLQQLN